MTAPAIARLNDHGQPIGRELPGWQPVPTPGDGPLAGHWGSVVRLDPAAHGDALFAAFDAAPDGRDWTYLPSGPFDDAAAFADWLGAVATPADPRFYTVLDADGRPCGLASLMRIVPEHGVIEIGHIHFSPALRRATAATEALYLMMRRAFDLGYRRCEWKCDALNAASRRAAERLGFSFEGVHRQAAVVKGRNRDTAWYSIVDSEWPPTRVAFESWLDPSNFDPRGRQIEKLGYMIAEARAEMLAP